MNDDLDLIKALRLTAEPPRSWIDAAALIPSTVGDLAEIDAIVNDPDFHRRFAEDPAAALLSVGMPATAPVMAAMRDRLA